MQGNATIDIQSFIDAQPVGAPQVRLLLTCAAVLFADGFDTQAIGYVAPAIARDWALPRGALGPVFSASLFGLMLGALIFGPLADRIGRKRIIVASTAVFGAGHAGHLAGIRHDGAAGDPLPDGLGLGGAMPNAVALTAEYSPHRRRATMVMTMFCGFSVGAGAGRAARSSADPGVRLAVRVPGGRVAPLLLVPVLAWALPESVRLLALHRRTGSGQSDLRIAGMLTRLFPAERFPPGARFVAHEATLAGLPVLHLFRGTPRTHDAAALGGVLHEPPRPVFPVQLAADGDERPGRHRLPGGGHRRDAAGGGRGSGTVTLGRLIDRFSFRALALIYLLAAAAIAGIGYSTHAPLLAGAAIFRRRLLHRGRPDRVQRAFRDVLPDQHTRDRRGLVAGHRACRVDHRAIGGRARCSRSIGRRNPCSSHAALPALIAALAALALAARQRGGAA